MSALSRVAVIRPHEMLHTSPMSAHWKLRCGDRVIDERRHWAGSGVDMKGGFRSFAASANRSLRDVGSRHLGNVKSGLFTATQHFGSEPKSLLFCVAANVGFHRILYACSLAKMIRLCRQATRT